MPTKYGTFTQRQKIASQVKANETIAANPYLYENLPNKKEFETRRKETKQQLTTLTPPDVSIDERPALERRQQLLEAFITKECPSIRKPAMPSDKEMWNNKSADRGKHMTWEQSVKGWNLDATGNPIKAKDSYGALLEWKDNQRRLHREDEETNPGIASTENLRPGSSGTSLVDARSMTYGLTPTARANYDQVFPDHEPTQVEKMLEENKSLAEKLAALEAKLDTRPRLQPRRKRSIIHRPGAKREETKQELETPPAA